MNWLLRSGSTLDLNATFHQHRVYVSPVRVLSEGRAEITAIKPCSRCGGAGGSDKWRDTGWTCFECNGEGITGSRVIKLYAQPVLDKINLTAEKRRATAQAKREAAVAVKRKALAEAAEKTQADNLAQFPDAIQAMLQFSGENDFITDLKQKFAEGVPFTERMAQAILRTITSATTRRQFDDLVEEIEQRTTPIKAGRQAISGYILNVKWQPDPFGGSTLKMLVLDERGAKIYGSLPKGMSQHFPRDEEGDLVLHKARRMHVRFTSTLKSSDSARFFFASRPGKEFTVTAWEDLPPA